MYYETTVPQLAAAVHMTAPPLLKGTAAHSRTLLDGCQPDWAVNASQVVHPTIWLGTMKFHHAHVDHDGQHNDTYSAHKHQHRSR